MTAAAMNLRQTETHLSLLSLLRLQTCWIARPGMVLQGSAGEKHNQQHSAGRLVCCRLTGSRRRLLPLCPQIHGPLDLRRDVSCLFVNRRHKDDEEMMKQVEAFRIRNKCEVVIMEKVDGAEDRGEEEKVEEE